MRAVELADFEPLEVWLDCKSVVDLYDKGFDHCTNGRRKAADLWRRLFAAAGPETKLKWCKGHATDADVSRGKTTKWLKDLNDNCDEFARRGSSLALHKRPNEHILDANKEASQWYAWIARYVENWPSASDAEMVPRSAKAKKELSWWKRHRL